MTERSKGSIFFWLLVLMVAWAPLPLASEGAALSGLLSFGLVGLLTALLIFNYLGPNPTHVPQRLRAAWLPIAALMLFLGLMVAQTLPIAGGPISVDAHRTQGQIMLTLGLISAFLLVLLLVDSRSRMRKLAWALVLSGIFQALLAIVLTSAQAKYSVLFFDINHANYALGTFGYRNSLANFLLLCISVGIGLLIAQMGFPGKKEESTAKDTAAGVLKFMLSPTMLLRLMLIIMVVALVLTKSRMGNAGLLITLVLVGLPLLFLTGRIRGRGLWLIGSILVIDVLLVGNLIGIDRVVDRLNETPIAQQSSEQMAQGFTQESVEARGGPAALTLGMIAERPLLGFGAGTFYTAFPRFSAPEFSGFYHHAHNDYAQFAAEVGLIGFGLLAVLVVASVWRTLTVIRQPNSATDSGLSFGLLLAIAAMLIHATVDFHLFMPANSLIFVIVIAMTWTLRKLKY
jgi:O-antigen ligase